MFLMSEVPLYGVVDLGVRLTPVPNVDTQRTWGGER